MNELKHDLSSHFYIYFHLLNHTNIAWVYWSLMFCLSLFIFGYFISRGCGSIIETIMMILSSGFRLFLVLFAYVLVLHHFTPFYVLNPDNYTKMLETSWGENSKTFLVFKDADLAGKFTDDKGIKNHVIGTTIGARYARIVGYHNNEVLWQFYGSHETMKSDLSVLPLVRGVGSEIEIKKSLEKLQEGIKEAETYLKQNSPN